jgi:hypothetical protein
VFRDAMVYAATAFAVLQAADSMLPRLAVPEWTLTLVVVFAVLGVAIALVLARALELTPDKDIPATSAGPTTIGVARVRTALLLG